MDRRVLDSVDDLERRLTADYALLLGLQAEDFRGPLWTANVRVLVEYGYAVMRPWIGSGMVFSRCREKGFGGRDMYSPVFVDDPLDVEDLAHETVAYAVVRFREMLREGKWDPARGATLKTYFIGKALSEFVEPYRRWRKYRQRWELMDEESLIRVSDRVRQRSTESLVVTAIELDDYLQRLRDPVDRAIVGLTVAGLSQDEIAAELGLASAGAVKSRLYRLRRQLEQEEHEQAG